MRIISGAFRGRRLLSPKSAEIRPTSDRVREAIFSIIASEIPGAQVLDLFAGTGAMGLEALSRGAASAVFVDRGTEAVRLIKENIELCKAGNTASIIRDTVPSAIKKLAAQGRTFEVIFMDPPYGMGLVEKTIDMLDSVAAPAAIMVAEHHLKDETPSELKLWSKETERRYGDTLVSIYSRG
ncbi:MAG: 16S rRNA (guanine(966)-N(2))-methyltransferase RsmD [Syntrophobacteraceae bacterium]